MLWLIFHVGLERFAIPGLRVDKVLPMVALHRAAQLPSGLAGAFSYRGVVTPVIDLAHWLLGNSTPLRLSTRMILIPLAAESLDQKFCVLADRVEELRAIDADNCDSKSLAGWSGSLALGHVIADEHGFLQVLDLDRLIAEAQRNALLPPVAERIEET